MFRWIQPDNGYCLYFPSRLPGKRFVAGQETMLRWGEKWKHVKLGVFPVILPEQGVPDDIYLTVDNMQCQVEADFKIALTASIDPAGIEERLAKATMGCRVTSDLKEKIELVFFQSWCYNYCRAAIRTVLQRKAFLPLFTDADYLMAALDEIGKLLNSMVGNIGLALLGNSIVVKPVPPGPDSPATCHILWNSLQNILAEKSLDAEIARNKIFLDGLEEERKKAIEEQRIATEKLLALREQKNREEKTLQAMNAAKEIDLVREKLATEKQKLEFQDKLDKLGHDKQITDIDLDMRIRKKREEADTEFQLDQKRKETVVRVAVERGRAALWDAEIEGLKSARTVADLKAALVEVQSAIAGKEDEIRKRSGLTEAEIEAAMVEARVADELALRKILFEKLPEFAASVAQPLARMGDIKITHLGGLAKGGEDNGLLGGMLASATTLPVIREILGYLGGQAGQDSRRQEESRTGDTGRTESPAVKLPRMERVMEARNA